MNEDTIKKILGSSDYTLKEYPSTVKSALEASKYVNLPTKCIAKTILVKIDSKYVLFLLSSNKKLDLKSLSNEFGEEIKMVDPSKIERITGHRIGTVTPIKTTKELSVYIDSELTNFDYIGIGSGIKGIEIVINPRDLIKLVGASILSLT